MTRRRCLFLTFVCFVTNWKLKFWSAALLGFHCANTTLIFKVNIVLSFMLLLTAYCNVEIHTKTARWLFRFEISHERRRIFLPMLTSSSLVSL